MAKSTLFQRALYQEAKEKRFPISANFELLPICNLNCKMCYVRMDMKQAREMGGLKSVEDWLELARQLRDMGTLFLLLTGGESFMYPDFKRLYIELYKMGFWITINTNGTMIDEEIVSWLREYPPKLVSMSLYGASNETYRELCGFDGMFDKVDRAAHLLKENHIRFELKTVLTPYNVHDLDACVEYAYQLGVYYERTNYSFPPERKKDKESFVRFSPQECEDVLFRINRQEIPPEFYLKGVVQKLQEYEDTKCIPGKDLYGFTCGGANNTCWITWQGYMTPCALLENPHTSPFEVGAAAAWEGLKEACDKILMSPKCSHCDKRALCPVCPAANHAETGSFEKHSEYHCERMTYRLEELRRMAKEYGLEEQIIHRGEIDEKS